MHSCPMCPNFIVYFFMCLDSHVWYMLYFNHLSVLLCFAMYVKVLAPLPIGFAVFMVHLATIPVTGTGINPARSLGAAVIYNQSKPWDDHVSIFFHIDQIHQLFNGNFLWYFVSLFMFQWIFWVGPFIGAAIAAFYHQFILRAGAAKALGSFRSNPNVWRIYIIEEMELMMLQV